MVEVDLEMTNGTVERRWGPVMVRSWPDLTGETERGRVYQMGRGWQLFIGKRRAILSYQNIRQGGRGHVPLSSRYGRDRAIEVRIGPHVWMVRV